MKKAKARLIKSITTDGLVEMFDDIPIGKIYEVDLDSKEEAHGYNVEFNQEWTREIIFDVKGGWLPTELLEIINEEETIKWPNQKANNRHSP